MHTTMPNKKVKRPIVTKKKEDVNKANNLQDYLYLIFIALYLFVDISPRDKIIDTSYQHRLYIDLINIAATVYIFRNFAKYRSHAVNFFTNSIPILYAGFIFFAFLSLFVAYSQIEGLINLASYVSNFWVFTNLFMLLFAARNNIKAVAIIVTFTLFYQVSMELYTFYQGLGKEELMSQIMKLTWNTGNKNIFAATIVIKLAFACYASLRTRGFYKLFSYLTVFITILLLFFLSARAAYISLAATVLILAIGNLLLFVKEKENRSQAIAGSLSLLVLFALAFFLSNRTLTHYQELELAKSKQAPSGYRTQETDSFLGDRLASIGSTDDASNSIRIAMWKEALHAWTKKPLLGYGVGNYRIYSDEITRKHYSTNVYFNHSHNDFVEILFESGLFAFLAYTGLFILALWFSIRILIGKNYSKERKLVTLVLLAAGFGFLVDSFFNFPLLRTNMNVLFLLILTLIIINFLGGRKKEEENVETTPQPRWPVLIYSSIIFLGIASLYINYQLYASGKSQYLVDSDSENQSLTNPKTKFNLAQVNKMLDYTFPVLGARGGEPISIKKGKYAYFEKKDKEALALADIGAKDAPYALHDERLKLLVYVRQQQLDSAYKYVKIIHNQMPYSEADYKLRVTLAARFGKIEDAKKSFQLYDSFRPSQEAYETYAAQLATNKYDLNQDKEILIEGVKRYPNSKILNALKQYYDFLAAAKKKS